MDHREGETGSQLVLDNRSLIIAFALLIVLCGSFFVIGFMEGKRQGFQRGSENAVLGSPAPMLSNTNLGEPKAGMTQQGAKVIGDKTVREQLDWYNKVNKRGNGGNESLEAPKAADSTAAAPPAGLPPSADPQKPTSELPKSTAGSERVRYSVQVGAFRNPREAEAKAAALKQKKYECVIEPPSSSDQLYLLKVGKLDSRAEAVALQLRLRKDGFKTFIKTDRQ